MDHMQPVPSSISHLVQVYQPATDAKIQNPQILHNSHPTLPTSLSTSDGKMDYQQTMTDVHMPSVSTMQNDMMNHNQIVMSQTHLQLPHTIQSQVIHPTDLTQQLQITSHMLLPPVPVYKQHMLVNEVQQYYGQYDYMKEPSDYIKEPTSYIKEPSSYIKETSSYIKETSSYIKEPSEYVKEPTDYMKEPSDYLKESSEYTKETSSFEQVVTKLEPDVQIHPEKTDENQSKPDDLPKLDSAESPPKKKKPRSETQNPSAWACNVRKLKHQRGEAYVSRRGKYVPERKIKTTKNCLTNCKYKCNELINDADRELIFKAFYSLNANEKKHFLLNTTERNHIKHSTPTENHKRKHSFKYFFIIRAEKYSVCKNFYLGTLAISQKPVYNVHLSKNELNIPKPDGRGHSETSAHALAKEIKDRVRQHIMSFETLDSKPIKQNSKKKQYLKKKMSIKKMFTMYYDECSKENATAVKESMYRKIFKRDFNLHFSKKSKKEEQLCCKCKGSLKKK